MTSLQAKQVAKVDAAVRRATAFRSFDDMLTTCRDRGYCPTLRAWDRDCTVIGRELKAEGIEAFWIGQ